MRYVIAILLTAVLTMLLIYAGYIKEKTLPYELTAKLYKRASRRVIEYLMEHNEASIVELKKSIKDVKASVMWSRKKVGITNPDQFIGYVIENMTKQGNIASKQQNGKVIYFLSGDNSANI